MAKIDLPTIKNTIATILSADLSALSTDMSKTVKAVYKVEPSTIPVQSTMFPCVYVFINEKGIDLDTIAVNQATAKRMGRVSVSIVGAVWNQNFSADITSDPADNDLEHLMENIENTLRANDTINGLSVWSSPGVTTYHNVNYDEETHFRVAIMEFVMRINY